MSKICMAAINDNDKTFNARTLQERFPEIPEAVIGKILSEHAHNMEKCIAMLSQESDIYLYGENSDGPVANNTPGSMHPPGIMHLPGSMQPLSIEIPSPHHPASDNSTNYYHGNDSPITPRTAGMPTSGSVTDEVRGDRPTPIDDYNRQLLKHQQQRLDRLVKEVQLEECKLFDLKSNVANKSEELVNKKFRVAGNPSKIDVDHLEEETQVLREEIDQMTHEIDRIKSLPMPLKKSESFPRPSPTTWINNHPGPMDGPQGPRPPWYTTQGPRCPRPPWLITQRSHSPERDKSLEGAGWILVPPGPQTSVVEPPNTSQNDTEQTWQCKHCTLVNHGALNHCEICERPRT